MTLLSLRRCWSASIWYASNSKGKQLAYEGKVLDYDKQHGFHVEYEDGDSEDMKESDLLKILTKTMRLDGPACLSGMSRRSTPRCVSSSQRGVSLLKVALTLT